MAFGAHPDDVEMGAAGTLLKLKEKGHWTGIIDLSKGELGTRGDATLRALESKAASHLLKLDARMQLDMGDGNIVNNEKNRKAIVKTIRKFAPDFIFINAPQDRHRDHGEAAALLIDAAFLSGLAKFNVGTADKPMRPKNIFHYIQDQYLAPHFVIDISKIYSQKMEVILSYNSQFFSPNVVNQGPETPISSQSFLNFFNGRAAQMGRLINTEMGEGFIAHQPINLTEMNWEI